METPFTYNTYVTKAKFLGRKDEITDIKTHILNREHILIYDGPKTGKTSLIYNSITEVKKTQSNIIVCTVNMRNLRDLHDIMKQLIMEVDTAYNEADLSKTAFYVYKKLIETEDVLEDSKYIELLQTIDSLENITGKRLIIFFKEFQNILLSDNGEDALKTLETALNNHYQTTYIISGNEVNAMKYIFEKKKFFYKFANRIHLSPIDRKIFSENIIRGFLRVGRVVEKEHFDKIYNLFDGHPYYINHISSLCFQLTIGYLSDKIISQALDILIAINEPYFKYMINNLSNYQLRFLKAINDGHTLFSSIDVISKYKLNSSANVYRVKEALIKKELITINNEDQALIMDPLFKYWVKNIYFKESISYKYNE